MPRAREPACHACTKCLTVSDGPIVRSPATSTSVDRLEPHARLEQAVVLTYGALTF